VNILVLVVSCLQLFHIIGRLTMAAIATFFELP